MHLIDGAFRLPPNSEFRAGNLAIFVQQMNNVLRVSSVVDKHVQFAYYQ